MKVKKSELSKKAEKKKAPEPSAKLNEKLTEILIRAKGEDRSFAAYARDANVSPAALTRIMNGDYLPTSKVLKKLTSPEAKPRGGVTYEELMVACGFGSEIKADNVLTDSEATPLLNPYAPISYNDRMREYREYEKEATSQVYTAFAEHGMLFRKVDMTKMMHIQADLIVELLEQPIKRWQFEMKYSEPVRTMPRLVAERMLTRIFLRYRPDADTKLSIVINDKHIFEIMKNYEHEVAFRGELSVILFDRENRKITDEIYLSNYNEGDQSKEIFIADK